MSGTPAEPASSPRRRACPTCGDDVRADQPDRPFCSRRCRLVDLGRWFNEEYAIPGEDAFSFDAPAVSPDVRDDGDGR